MTTRLRVTAVLLALFAAACQPQGEGTAGEAPETKIALDSFKAGDLRELDLAQDMAAPASSFVDAAGATHTFAEFKGKVVVFNVWAEWCAPCVEEMPTLAKLQEAFDRKDVVVIPIAFGYEKDKESTKAKLHSLVGEALPFYYDTAFNVNADAKTGSFPSTIIYDKEGMEKARLLLPADWGSDQAKKLVQAVLDGAA